MARLVVTAAKIVSGIDRLNSTRGPKTWIGAMSNFVWLCHIVVLACIVCIFPGMKEG